ncbi:hypothetical protein BBJ28_00010927 [Nothophytophthora sp. Chile5]|nr:hypothetical protein BBJ28_00010927 [Nothophytophthora sp. Chile5]
MAQDGAAPAADALVIFDFDYSLVEVDSSVHIGRALHAEAVDQLGAKYRAGDVTWPQLMDEFLVQLAVERPLVSSEGLRDAAAHVPVDSCMLDAVRLAVDEFGATCKIVSDATVFYIQSFLDHHALTSNVNEVVANPTHFEDGGKTLRVRPFHGPHLAPHGCPNCPVHLCKGSVDGKPFELLEALNANPSNIQAQIQEWTTGEDIYKHFQRFFLQEYPEHRATVIETQPLSVPKSIPRASNGVLVVFDYDESLVNEDSDSLVFRVLHPELLATIADRHAQNPVWPQVFDDMLQVLAEEKPEVSIDLIRETVAQIPIQPRMLDAVRLVVERYGAEVKIISDSNSVYIQSMLERQGLMQHVSEVFTNPAEYEESVDGHSRLRIRPYHAEHLERLGCAWCPVNMCKGSVIDAIRSAQPYARVLYVGDGVGDFCPATRLTKYDADDVVFARSAVAGGKPYGLQTRIDANPGSVDASVVPWSTGFDIYRHFVRVFQPKPSIPRAIPRVSGGVLVIFDYDWSLINENSDTFVFQVLHPELLLTLRDRCAKQPSWTKVMDDMLQVLAEEKPEISAHLIRETVAQVPIQPRMLDAVRLAVEQYSADVKIVSDANQVYIGSMLKHHGLTKYVSEVITNPAEFELLANGSSRLHVRPYHAESGDPHRCEWCPTNMCKGRIVEAIRSTQSYSRVLYVGDGSGDFCAATRLSNTNTRDCRDDVVFARADEATGKTYGLQKRISANPGKVCASIVPWSTGDDIYRHFAHFFHSLE